ncbi:MAG: DUF2934 domain-containing protein [Bryobacteraceae bacterium]|nr:DUF2934 domain-containing protein [Bryobacteraceae bacterium]
MAQQARPKTEMLPGTAATQAAASTGSQFEPAIQPPDREEIAALAYQYWLEGGRREGTAEEDWIRAEQELLRQRMTRASSA